MRVLCLFRPVLYELKTLRLVVRQPCFEEYGVHTKLSVQQRHVAIHFHKEVDALVALVKVGIVM